MAIVPWNLSLSPSAGAEFRAPGPNREQVSAAHLRNSLPLVALGLAVVFAHMGVGHWVLEHGPHCPSMAWTNGATAAGFSLLAGVLVWRPPPLIWGHVIAAGIVGVILANSAGEMALTGDPGKTDSFVLLMVGASALVLSRRWFWRILGTIALTWALITLAHSTSGIGHLVGGSVPPVLPTESEWTHSGLTMVIGAALAAVLHETRHRLYFRMEDLLEAYRFQQGRLREALRDSRHGAARMSAVLNGTFDAIITFDPEGRIEGFSPAATRIFGYAPEEVIGRNVEMLWAQPVPATMSGSEEEPLRAAGNPAVRTPGRMHEIEGLRRDGSRFPLELSVSEVEVEDQRVLTAVARDVTRRKEAEALALRETREREAAEARADLARDVHDGMLQVMTGVLFQLAEIERATSEDPSEASARVKSLRNIMAEEQSHLRFFVDTLKQRLAKPGGPEEEDLSSKLRALTALTSAVWNVSIDLVVRVHDRVPGSTAHEVCRLVQEAMVNAARHGHARTIRVSVEQVGGHLCLTISDNGRGFPFAGRYDDTELRRRKIGPAMLQDRVRVNNGRLSLESRADGATVTIVLPAIIEPSAS